jgi:hypothetical protein
MVRDPNEVDVLADPEILHPLMQPHPLPLAWTRIPRTSCNSIHRDEEREKTKRPREDSLWDDDDDDDDDDNDNEDGGVVDGYKNICVCRRRRTNVHVVEHVIECTAVSVDATSTNNIHPMDASITTNDDTNTGNNKSSTKPRERNRNFLSGNVWFCLPDPDCDWFQGYYLVTNQPSSFHYGLLCHVQQDIDECLQCSEGGYREVTMQMTKFEHRRTNRSTIDAKQVVHNVPNILWTGGDMMHLITKAITKTSLSSSLLPKNTVVNHTANNNTQSSSPNVVTNPTEISLRMQTTTLYTGPSAIPYVQKYFTSLLRNICNVSPRTNDIDDGDDDSAIHRRTDASFSEMKVMQLMPNVAVVSGTMNVWL